MLTILLKILSVLGILLLILLGVVLAVILLVLFFPVGYKVSGKKNTEEVCFSARIKWLFGLARVSYSYPEPGKLLAKVLFFTIYDSSAEKKETAAEKTTKDVGQDTGKNTEKTEKTDSSGQALLPGDTDITDTENTADAENPVKTTSSAEETNTDSKQKPGEKIAGIFEKIRYTIRRICDKIKHILKNISFYKELWSDPDTQGLLKHAGSRIGHILKRLRPRKLLLNARIGTGSPDTTGYLYGIYGMLLPKLGKGVCVTPDFEQAIVEVDLKASGHFTVACVLIHSLRLILDRRLRQLIHKIRQYQKNQKK